MKKIYLIILTNVLLLALQYGFTALFSTQGESMTTMQHQIDSWVKQNSVITNQINELSSLNHISNRSQALNLVPLKIDFITIPGLAARPD